MDWIDDIADERSRGITRALDQSTHEIVNARYPGCTLEHCCKCEQPTGRAGRGEDSLYTETHGPFCEECYHIEAETEELAVSQREAEAKEAQHA